MSAGGRGWCRRTTGSSMSARSSPYAPWPSTPPACAARSSATTRSAMPSCAASRPSCSIACKPPVCDWSMSTATPQADARASGTMVPRAYRVLRRRRDTSDTWTLTLEPETGDALAYGPGQFTMLSSIGIGEVPISISGDPTRPGPLVHTVRAVGQVTRAICSARPGSVLGVRGPFGTAWPVDAAEGADLVIVAGGIGLAPLRPVVYHALRHRRRFGRVVLLYGARPA